MKTAIVDYGMGNLFSVAQACATAGLAPVITSTPAEVESAAAVIVPGTGGFPDAMAVLERERLVGPIMRAVEDGRPVVGICLGMQLLMDEGSEFGRHRGLGVIPGTVERFASPQVGRPEEGAALGHLKVAPTYMGHLKVAPTYLGHPKVAPTYKVPQVGWNRLSVPVHRHPGSWRAAGVSDGDFMYFVHSYYVKPADAETIAATSTYAGVEFCAALSYRNVIGWQFHPERSGPRGLELYRALAQRVREES
jgi:imidazole glycerol-phosphate synthase subunit HisH